VRPAATPAPQPVTRSLLDVRPADEVRSAFMTRGETRTPGGSRTAFAWTPDGRALVFAGIRGGTRQLFVRSLDGDEAKPLPGTEGAHVPVVSPDGTWVAFWSDGAIRKAPLAGGPSTVIADNVRPRPSGMDWGTTGLLVFDQGGGTVSRVRGGSSPEPVTKLEEGEGAHMNPHLLPGDTVVLFTVRKREWTWGDEEVAAQSMVSGKRTVLLQNAADARYVRPGRLLFMRRGKLLAVAFDPATLEVKGEQVTVLDNVAQALTSNISSDVTGAGQLAVSSGGALAYIASPLVPFADGRLVTVDRRGTIEPLPTPARSFSYFVDLSPDGRRLVVPVSSLDDARLWIYDLARGTFTPLTPRGGEALYNRWAPDGRHIAFPWLQSGARVLAWQQADGVALPETLSREGGLPSSWTPDGRELAVVTADRRISVLDVGASPRQLRPLAEPPLTGMWPTFSPDGHWLAYGSDASGRLEVYLQPYPGPGPRMQVSVDGGGCPSWNPNGRELFFLAPVDPLGERMRMMSVDVALGGPATLGPPRQLFEFSDSEVNLWCTPINCHAVAHDGQHFLTTDVVKVDPPPVTHINLVLNWLAELEAKVPSGL
jgi:eukaryotic-like serine/threonine-protein kinase